MAAQSCRFAVFYSRRIIKKKQNRYDQQQKSALGNLMANRSGVPSHSLIRGPPSGNLVSASSSTGRPYSSSSTSLPNTPRIRELSSSSGYNFTSSGATSNAHINKRRRGGTPTSSFGTSRANSFLMGGDGSNAKYNPVEVDFHLACIGGGEKNPGCDDFKFAP
eukprot:CAMPEP_0194272412 /NCGR_PEP_ID=MMETSP0169-20130528/5993_1 /TAXON_ID=218684 /ORGANISM="Corethron pennatum, Strain L29A3" /LENGTH=162 /DNA_ID=CAMNT_0039015071 /DNA_START=1007 /DNA_END=1496 /DNA_ORIENTATION=+